MRIFNRIKTFFVVTGLKIKFVFRRAFAKLAERFKSTVSPANEALTAWAIAEDACTKARRAHLANPSREMGRAMDDAEEAAENAARAYDMAVNNCHTCLAGTNLVCRPCESHRAA